MKTFTTVHLDPKAKRMLEGFRAKMWKKRLTYSQCIEELIKGYK